MSADCTFCRVLGGDLPATILEDATHAIVMLDRNQAARGHVLVIGKQHVAAWDELDEPTVMEMAALARRWAARLREALGVRAYNLLVNCGPDAGQDVMHAHLHVTPRVAGDGYYMFGGKQEVLAAADMEAIASTLRARA